MTIDYKAIGQRIKIARIKKEITQEALAEKVSLSTPHMSNVETGNTKLSLPTVIAVANALDVSVDELLCDNVLRSKSVFVSEAQGIFEDCSDYEVRIIVDILKSIKDTLRRDKAFRDNMGT